MSGSNGHSPTVLLRFDEDEAPRAAEALRERTGSAVTVISPSDVLRGTQELRAAGGLAIVGSPPADGIGYSLAPFAAAISRVGEVTLLDASSGTARVKHPARFLLESLPGAVGQLA
ncbi:MAG: hypothetical protein M3340_12785, partial [Actinomycetota bacterium]|nr:hypothetical protein [Actinomycetota bacterium]